MTNWIDYDTTEEYTLPIAFPNTKIVTRKNNRGKTKIAVCSSCKSERTHRYPPILSPIPEEINAIPMTYRKNLSPIHMNCTLGRSLGSNPYTNYRHLQGFINLSKNKHALQLYSGLIGAFLNQEQNESSNWFHPTLTSASQWLKDNNPIFKEYNRLSFSETPIQNTTNQPYPTAKLTNVPFQPIQNQPPSLIVPNDNFPIEIHNEDYKYQHLIAGFLKTDDNDLNLPIPNYNPDIEPLLFPDLFPSGHYHYEDSKKLLEFKRNIDSYGKYIKLRLLCPDPRFRLHWYWPH